MQSRISSRQRGPSSGKGAACAEDRSFPRFFRYFGQGGTARRRLPGGKNVTCKIKGYGALGYAKQYYTKRNPLGFKWKFRRIPIAAHDQRVGGIHSRSLQRR